MLETEIKKLNSNIEKLNDLLTEAVKMGALSPAAQEYAQAKGVISEPVVVEKQAEPESDNDEAEQKAEKFTRETLQAVCLRLVRENREHKAKIKKVLSDFGVATITKLEAKDITAAHIKIREACGEVKA